MSHTARVTNSFIRTECFLLTAKSPTPSSILGRTRAHLLTDHFPACFCLSKLQVPFFHSVLYPELRAKSGWEWWAFNAWAQVRGFRLCWEASLLPLLESSGGAVRSPLASEKSLPGKVPRKETEPRARTARRSFDGRLLGQRPHHARRPWRRRAPPSGRRAAPLRAGEGGGSGSGGAAAAAAGRPWQTPRGRSSRP